MNKELSFPRMLGVPQSGTPQRVFILRKKMGGESDCIQKGHAQIMKAIVNTKLIMEDGIIWDGAVLIDGDKIAAAGWRDEVQIPEGTERIDAGGKYTAPGFVDIHCHGCGPANFDETPVRCAEHFLKHGTTTVLPTFYANMSLEGMLEGAKRVKQASLSGAGRIMNGLYMEGPFMNGSGSFQSGMKWRPGTHAEDYMPLVDGLGDMVRVWAIDPDRENIEEFMAYAKKVNPNVLFAVGHSNASYEACKRLEHYGLRVRTHICDGGNCGGAVKGLNGAGGDEYALYNPDVYAELICDRNAVHVVPGLVKLYARTKGVEKMILITDSMCDKSNGAYKNDPERVPFGPDLNYDETGWLAGSHLTMDNACRNMMTHSGYGLCHAVRMASLNPAKLLGLDQQIGSIAAGKTANLLLMDDAIHIEKVFLQGECAVDNA